MTTTTRKRYFRNDADRFHYVQTLKSCFRRLHDEAKRKGLPQKELLEMRDRLLKGDRINTRVGDWEKLTGLDQAELFGYWSALADSLIDDLTYRYLINGLWYTGLEVIEGKDGTDPARDITTGPDGNGHYVYTFDVNGRTEYRIYF